MSTQNQDLPPFNEMARQILQKTHDGDDLAPHHLRLVQDVVNAGPHGVSEDMEAAFVNLYFSARCGYQKPWLHDIEHLTQDHDGYVYWKDRQVEHYSHNDMKKQRKEAQELAERCKKLEARGILVNSISAIWKWQDSDGPPTCMGPHKYEGKVVKDKSTGKTFKCCKECSLYIAQ